MTYCGPFTHQPFQALQLGPGDHLRPPARVADADAGHLALHDPLAQVVLGYTKLVGALPDQEHQFRVPAGLVTGLGGPYGLLISTFGGWIWSLEWDSMYEPRSGLWNTHDASATSPGRVSGIMVVQVAP